MSSPIATSQGPLQGLEWGRQYLRVSGWPPADAAYVEELIISVDNRDDFAYRVSEEHKHLITLNQGLFLWDLLHGTLSLAL
jgi:hypothetical protein